MWQIHCNILTSIYFALFLWRTGKLQYLYVGELGGFFFWRQMVSRINSMSKERDAKRSCNFRCAQFLFILTSNISDPCNPPLHSYFCHALSLLKREYWKTQKSEVWLNSPGLKGSTFCSLWMTTKGGKVEYSCFFCVNLSSCFKV